MSNWIEAIQDDDLALLKDAIDNQLHCKYAYREQFQKMTWLHPDDYKYVHDRIHLEIECIGNLLAAFKTEQKRRIREKVPSPE